MKSAIRKIDRALKHLYQLDSPFQAEDFMLKRPPASLGEAQAECHGTLYLREPKPAAGEALEIGIYLSDRVAAALAKLSWNDSRRWSHEALSAFSVAAEEVSHFHCFLYRATNGLSVSQFELEVQGEIDKFLLSFFVGNIPPEERAAKFSALFDKIFVTYHWREGMSPEETNRYADANRFAMRFIQKWGRHLSMGHLPELALRMLRRYYRLGPADKVSFISG